MLRTERGASALLLAASLLLLMGMAAVAIDTGAAFNERRQDQSAADAAALAAGVEFIIGSGELQAVAAAKDYVDDNLGRTLAATDWSTCQDPDSYGPTPATASAGLHSTLPCISFGNSGSGLAFDRIRVRVPDQDTDTTFGRILGVISISTSAIAEVELAPVVSGGAFPASVFNGAVAGSVVCIKTGTGGATELNSCGNPSSGNFGSFNPYFYTDIGPSNPDTTCVSGNQVDPLAYVMANGLDHTLGVASGVGAGTRVNGGACPSQPGPINPDRVDSGSGYSSDDVTQGLITGGTYDSVSYLGRLNKPTPWSGSGTYGTATVFTEDIDNRPLWTFITAAKATAADDAINAAAGTTTFDACSVAASGPNFINVSSPGTETQFATARDALIDCLTAYVAQGINLSDGLFDEALYDSRRLTVVPEYWQSAPLGNNSCCYDIKDFRPVYINSIWTANSNQWTCDGAIVSQSGNFCRHDPGRSGTIHVNASGQRKVSSADGILLNCEMLPGLEDPQERCKKVETASGNTITQFLNLFLVK